VSSSRRRRRKKKKEEERTVEWGNVFRPVCGSDVPS